MESGAFAQCSIFHNIFKSFQNLTEIFLEFFQCCLKIENDVGSKNSLRIKGLRKPIVTCDFSRGVVWVTLDQCIACSCLYSNSSDLLLLYPLKTFFRYV